MSGQEQMVESYDHFLYYDDPEAAKVALAYIQEEFDPSAEVVSEAEGEIVLTTGYAYTVVFTTDGEFSEEEAEALFADVSPDAYDLNVAEDDEEEEEDPFPSVFTSAERELAASSVENGLTLEYILRLERVAYTAYAYYAKTCSLRVALPRASYDIASLSMDELTKALHEELASVDFMR